MISVELPTRPYVIKSRDPLELKDFTLRFHKQEKLLGIPKGHPGPGPNGGEDYAPYCSADIVAIEAGVDGDSDADMVVNDD